VDVDNSGRSQLETEFDHAMSVMCDRFHREIGYNPTTFRRMVADHGGAEAARRLLSSSQPQSGLDRLWEHGRLGDSVEAHALDPRYTTLFTAKQRMVAQRRLEAHGYHVEDH
jgi:hypothetical protein